MSVFKTSFSYSGGAGLTSVVILSYNQPVKSRISLLCFTWGDTGVSLL